MTTTPSDIQKEPSTKPPDQGLSGATDVQKEPKGLNQAFNLVYRVIALLIALCFIGMFILAILDIVKYLNGEARQQTKAALNRELLNKDTTDMESLGYLKNDRKKEKYNIFMEVQIISGIYMIAGIAMFMLAIQLSSFIIFKVYAILRNKPNEEEVSLPPRNLGVIIFGIVGAYILQSIYQNKFIDQVQPSLSQVVQRMRTLKSFIYNNMAGSATFFNNLTGDDLDEALNEVYSNIDTSTTAKAGTQLLANDYVAIKMLFTACVYNFFRDEIPEGDPAFTDIKAMFTVNGLKTQSVDPTSYLYYRSSLYVPNIYPSVSKKMASLLGNREHSFKKQLASRLRELNRQLAGLQDISSGKSAVHGYLWTMLIVLGVFVLVFLGMYIKEAQPMLEKIGCGLKRAGHWIYGLFSKKATQ
jgi:hypothetical protein